MLEAKHLKKVYKPKKGVPVYALDDVSLVLPDTGMVFILGKSGSGKSTLLNVLGGLDKYDEGEIIIKGVSSAKFKQKHFDSYRNTYIGFIFQEYNILDEFSIGANIALAIELQGRKPANDEINKILADVDLSGMGNRKPNELSGGQKQRVAIARALVKNPQIIMADEPTGALDSKTGKQVFDTLKKLSKEKLVIIVSHDREFSEQYADRIIELADGKIISDMEYQDDGNVGEVLEPGLNFKENEIEIPEDYVLTEEDTKAINDYLTKRKNGHKVRLGIISHGKQGTSGGKFVDTDESKIKRHTGDDFKLIKSKLSLKNAFKMGANSMNHKKGRLVFTIILSIIAFSLFGVASTVSNYNHVNTVVSSLSDSGIKYIAFQKGVNEYPNDNNVYFNRYNKYFTEKELNSISNDVGENFKGALAMQTTLRELYDTSNVNSYFGECGRIYSVVTYTKDELKNNFGYSVKGEMPQNSDEIAISRFSFELFKKCGFTFKNAENKDEKLTINNEYDLIGKQLNIDWSTNGKSVQKVYTITAIVDTNFDMERYGDYLFNTKRESTILDMVYAMELETVLGHSLASSLFVSENEYQYLSSLIVPVIQYNDYFYFDGVYNKGSTQYYFSIGGQPVAFSTIKSTDYILFDNSETLDRNGVLISTMCFNQLLETIPLSDTHRANIKSDFDRFSEADKAAVKEFFSSYNYSDCGEGLLMEFVSQIHNENFEDLTEEQKENYRVMYQNKDLTEDEIKVVIEYKKLDFSSVYNYMMYLNDLGVSPMGAFKTIWQYYNQDVMTIINGTEWNYLNYKNADDATGLEVKGIYYDTENTEFYSTSMAFSDEFLASFGAEPNGIYYSVIASMPDSQRDIQKIVEYAEKTYNNGTVKYFIQNPVNAILEEVKDMLSVLGTVFFWIGFGFAVFASLMMLNFISTSVNFKKREIGILRAIGARSNDVFKIFFAESFIISMINFLFSTAITFGVTMFINNYLRNEYGLLITILRFGIIQVAVILAISVGVSTIASFLPVKRIAAKKPIDAIRDK